jgi:hypothetical protein
MPCALLPAQSPSVPSQYAFHQHFSDFTLRFMLLNLVDYIYLGLILPVVLIPTLTLNFAAAWSLRGLPEDKASKSVMDEPFF